MKKLIIQVALVSLTLSYLVAQNIESDITINRFQDAIVVGKISGNTSTDDQIVGSNEIIRGLRQAYQKFGEREVPKLNKESFVTRGILDASSLYDKNSTSVVLLVTPDCSSLGAGCLISFEGQILTNWHVINGNKTMLVYFYDKSMTKIADLKNSKYFVAKVVGTDPNRDLALLSLGKSNKVGTFQFAKSGTIRIAQDVFAIGHPESYIWSFTSGVISQLRNKYEWSTNSNDQFKANVIQTQTPINPGNSGGPLFNSKGELIGINSFRTSDAEGLNFAIRIDEIEGFLKEWKSGLHRTVINEKKSVSKQIIWDKLDLDNDGRIDAEGADTDENGKYDFIKIYKKNSNEIAIVAIDTNDDGKIDVKIYDKNGDAKFEYFLIDNDFNGTFETIGFDTDGDGLPDKFQ